MLTSRSSRLACAVLCLAFAALPLAVARAGHSAFVQERDAEADAGASLAAAFKRANGDGNLIVAYVVWDGAESVSLADTQGNVYASAVGPTPGAGGNAQVFYARDVRAGKNAVTATFSEPVASHAALFVHEYTSMSHGAPFDVSVAASGSDPNVAVGGLETNTSGELLFLAVTSDGSAPKSLTPGYKARAKRGGTLTADAFSGDAGTWAAAALQSGTGWTAQLVGFAYTGIPPKGTPKYPVKVGPVGPDSHSHYLVDQNDRPFLITGDSPQALFVNVSEADAAKFLDDRRKRGFNVVWVNLLSAVPRDDSSTLDGILPFSAAFATSQNEAYFARVDREIRLAAERGITVLLDPAETRKYLPYLQDIGPDAARDWGRWVGRRYRGFDNIIWMSGNDFYFGALPSPDQDEVVQAVALGIQDVDPSHVHTVELFFYVSGSLDDPSWAPLIQLNASYTYYPTYAQVLTDYDRPNALPTFLAEANYEFENEAQGDVTNEVLRRQVYWALLAGATGHLYGNGYTWQFKADWQSHYKTEGAAQMTLAKKLFEARPWWELVPDEDHTTVVDGFGTFDAGTFGVLNNDYVTAARTPDGGLVMAYVPAGNAITVDLSRLSGRVRARWFDPSSGAFKGVRGSPFDNEGTHVFETPGANHDRDLDWVLVLEAD